MALLWCESPWLVSRTFPPFLTSKQFLLFCNFFSPLPVSKEKEQPGSLAQGRAPVQPSPLQIGPQDFMDAKGVCVCVRERGRERVHVHVCTGRVFL